jgi:hypothetical protein
MKLVFGLSSPTSYILKTNFPILINQLRFRKKTWKNETWIDSGGYQIILHGLEISIDDVLQKYKMIDAYAFFSLDIPSIFASLDKRNFEYFEYLYTKIEYIEKIIPVIHIYPIQDVDEAIDFYKQYTYYFAVGGLVASSKMKILIYTFPWVFYVRKKVPYLHVLGMPAPYFIQAFNFAESMDTATYTKITGFRELFWFDGSRKYVGNRKTTRERYRLTEEEKEQFFEFLDKINFPFEYDLNNRKILEVMNAYILVYNEWRIDNKYTRYADKLRKMGLDSLSIELIRNYKIGSELLKEKKKIKKEEDELEIEI